jgi:hypothetical protein
MRLGVHNMNLFVKLFTFANIFPDGVKLRNKTFHFVFYKVGFILLVVCDVF